MYSLYDALLKQHPRALTPAPEDGRGARRSALP